MERFIDMISPITGGRVKEVSTTEVKEFRKEKFRVHVRYCVCEDTGEQFTTTEQDTLQFNDLYSQYRTKHGIPFPDEIKRIRLNYGLNYSQISRLLGFGANQYAKYEAGEVPSESNGKMIAAIRDKNVALDLLKGCKDSFREAEFNKILASIITSNLKTEASDILFNVIFKDEKRSIYNGYGIKSLPKLFDMVRLIISSHGEVFPTKLNKLMFYADFCHYRNTGVSISGLRYLALNFGPVPEHYATIYDQAPDLRKRLIERNNIAGTLLSCKDSGDYIHLSSEEMATIRGVVEALRPLSIKEIIQASHSEICWQKYEVTQDFIPYDEAFDLTAL